MSLGATASAPAAACEMAVLREQLERHVVVDRAVVAQHAAVPVRRVLAEAHVGDHDELGMGLLDRADGELHHALVVVGARSPGRPSRRGCRRGAPPAMPERVRLAGLLDRVGDREPARRRASPRSACGSSCRAARTSAGRGGRAGARSRGPCRAGRRSCAGGAGGLAETPWMQSLGWSGSRDHRLQVPLPLRSPPGRGVCSAVRHLDRQRSSPTGPAHPWPT